MALAPRSRAPVAASVLPLLFGEPIRLGATNPALALMRPPFVKLDFELSEYPMRRKLVHIMGAHLANPHASQFQFILTNIMELSTCIASGALSNMRHRLVCVSMLPQYKHIVPADPVADLLMYRTITLAIIQFACVPCPDIPAVLCIGYAVLPASIRRDECEYHLVKGNPPVGLHLDIQIKDMTPTVRREVARKPDTHSNPHRYECVLHGNRSASKVCDHVFRIVSKYAEHHCCPMKHRTEYYHRVCRTVRSPFHPPLKHTKPRQQQASASSSSDDEDGDGDEDEGGGGDRHDLVSDFLHADYGTDSAEFVERNVLRFVIERGGFERACVTLPSKSRIKPGAIARAMRNLYFELPARSFVFDLRMIKHQVHRAVVGCFADAVREMESLVLAYRPLDSVHAAPFPCVAFYAGLTQYPPVSVLVYTAQGTASLVDLTPAVCANLPCVSVLVARRQRINEYKRKERDESE